MTFTTKGYKGNNTKIDKKMPAEFLKGVIKTWNITNGVGFTYSDTHKKGIFCHVSHFEGGPKEGATLYQHGHHHGKNSVMLAKYPGKNIDNKSNQHNKSPIGNPPYPNMSDKPNPNNHNIQGPMERGFFAVLRGIVEEQMKLKK